MTRPTLTAARRPTVLERKLRDALDRADSLEAFPLLMQLAEEYARRYASECAEAGHRSGEAHGRLAAIGGAS